MAQFARNAAGELFQWDASSGQYIPSSEGGALEGFATGASNAVQNVVSGINELGGKLESAELGFAGSDASRGAAQSAVQQNLDRQNQRLEASRGLENRNPIASALGGAAPGLALGAATAGAGFIPTMVIEGGLGAVSGAGKTSAERMVGAGIGAALGGTGYVLGAGLGRMAGRVSGDIRQSAATAQGRSRFFAGAEGDGSPGRAFGAEYPAVNAAGQRGLAARMGARAFNDAQPNTAAIRDAEALGFQLTPADQVGSRTQKNLEASFQSSAGGQAPFQRIQNANQDRMNELSARAAGLDATEFNLGDKMDPQALGVAELKIGKGFEEIAQRAGQVDLTNSKRAATAAAKGLDLTDEAAKALQIIERIPDKANGASVYGRYSRIRQQQAAAQLRNEVDLERALDKTANAMLKDLGDAVGGEGQQQIAKLQEEWLFLKSIESAVTTDGDVPIQQLARRLAKGKFSRAKWKGTSDVGTDAGNDLMRATRAMVNFKDRVGNSGTATRLGGGMDIAKGMLMRPAVEAYLGNYGQAAGGAALLGGAASAGGVFGE